MFLKELINSLYLIQKKLHKLLRRLKTLHQQLGVGVRLLSLKMLKIIKQITLDMIRHNMIDFLL